MSSLSVRIVNLRCVQCRVSIDFPFENRTIYVLPVHHIASAVSEGELRYVTTLRKERYTMNDWLKTLEANNVFFDGWNESHGSQSESAMC